MPRPSPYTRTPAHLVENGLASLNIYGSLAGTCLVDSLFVYPMMTKKMKRKMEKGVVMVMVCDGSRSNRGGRRIRRREEAIVKAIAARHP